MADLPASRKSPAAERTRRWRDRQRSGRILLQIEFDEAELVDALVSAGHLSLMHADDREKIAAAAQKARALILPR